MTTTAPLLQTTSDKEELRMLRVAREIAMDIHTLGEILKNNNVTVAEWERMKINPRFTALLSANMAEWHSASNVQERVRLKSAYVLEEYLPDLNRSLNDGTVALSAKVEAVKLLAKVAGVDRGPNDVGESGPKFSVVINLGNGESRKIDAITLPGNQYHEIENELE